MPHLGFQSLKIIKYSCKISQPNMRHPNHSKNQISLRQNMLSKFSSQTIQSPLLTVLTNSTSLAQPHHPHLRHPNSTSLAQPHHPHLRHLHMLTNLPLKLMITNDFIYLYLFIQNFLFNFVWKNYKNCMKFFLFKNKESINIMGKKNINKKQKSN